MHSTLRPRQDLPERLAVPPRNPRTTVRGPTRATAPRAAAPTADARRRGARAAQRVAVAYGGETYPAHYIFGPQHSQQAVYKAMVCGWWMWVGFPPFRAFSGCSRPLVEQKKRSRVLVMLSHVPSFAGRPRVSEIRPDARRDGTDRLNGAQSLGA